MMQHYMDTKAAHKDCILFYRLGDFYEMFFEDAVLVSRELQLTLTGKECGLPERAPMCGVPHHAVDSYLTELVKKGYRVAIAEQVEDPKLAKGLVKREVIRIVTPGTITSKEALEEGKPLFLVALFSSGSSMALAASDITTGEFFTMESEEKERVLEEASKLMPSELLTDDTCLLGESKALDEFFPNVPRSFVKPQGLHKDAALRLLSEHFSFKKETGFPVPVGSASFYAASALLHYLYDTQKMKLQHINRWLVKNPLLHMGLDLTARRNLELLETMRDKDKKGSLLACLDETKTAMGARLLRRLIVEPLLRLPQIEERHEAVEELLKDVMKREELREALRRIYDMERLMGRLSNGSANPRDLLALSQSLSMLPEIKDLLKDSSSALLKKLMNSLDPLPELCSLLMNSISVDAPVSSKDGGIINDGFDAEVDELRVLRKNGRNYLLDIVEKEKEKTGIKNLKISYNKVFGFFLEVTNSNLKDVPDYFIRKQTLANCERFYTPELKEMEEKVLHAEEKLVEREYELFTEIRRKTSDEMVKIQETAKALSYLDVLSSLAFVAQEYHYVRPKMTKKGEIRIQNARHPVVERMTGRSRFVPNDVFLDEKENRIMILTGPNMAGKSTYMREVALIVLLAQMGSFVPADSAEIGICDQIFTRVGASDDLAAGQSTFMVEMNEMAEILQNATKKSLLILDEIGRGTGTFDGMSIAWAVLEHLSLSKLKGVRTLFATHYHELTELEGMLDGVKNYCIAVREEGDGIEFLRKIIRGGADQSYGIEVARLAGLPESLIQRAKELLGELKNSDILTKAREIAENSKRADGKSGNTVRPPDIVDRSQLSFFQALPDETLLRELASLDLDRMTPIDALNTLIHFQSKLKNRI